MACKTVSWTPSQHRQHKTLHINHVFIAFAVPRYQQHITSWLAVRYQHRAVVFLSYVCISLVTTTRLIDCLMFVSFVYCCYSVGVIVWLRWLRNGLIAAPAIIETPTRTMLNKNTALRISANASGRGPIPEITAFQKSRSRTGTTRRSGMCTRRSSVTVQCVATTLRSVPYITASVFCHFSGQFMVIKDQSIHRANRKIKAHRWFPIWPLLNLTLYLSWYSRYLMRKFCNVDLGRFKVIQGQRSWCQSIAQMCFHVRLPLTFSW